MGGGGGVGGFLLEFYSILSGQVDSFLGFLT